MHCWCLKGGMNSGYDEKCPNDTSSVVWVNNKFFLSFFRVLLLLTKILGAVNALRGLRKAATMKRAQTALDASFGWIVSFFKFYRYWLLLYLGTVVLRGLWKVAMMRRAQMTLDASFGPVVDFYCCLILYNNFFFLVTRTKNGYSSKHYMTGNKCIIVHQNTMYYYNTIPTNTCVLHILLYI